jgi:hypothetical protein
MSAFRPSRVVRERNGVLPFLRAGETWPPGLSDKGCFCCFDGLLKAARDSSDPERAEAARRKLAEYGFGEETE